MKLEPKYRRSLNTKQLSLLSTIYKFRFATTELLSNSKSPSSLATMRGRLKVLYGQRYIDRFFDETFQLTHKPAVYFLDLRSIGVLRTKPEFSPNALNNMYKNRSRSQEFIEHCLHIFTIYRRLQRLYGGQLNFFSKNELYKFNYFPKLLPDGYFVLTNDDSETEYLLELFDQQERFPKIKRRIFNHIKHIRSGKWQTSGSFYPTILLICVSSQDERLLQRYAAKTFDNNDLSGHDIRITTLKALINSTSRQDLIWSDVFRPERLLSLNEI